MTGKIRIALVGAGKMGERWAHAISRHPQTCLAAIVDINQEKAEKLGKTYGAETKKKLFDLNIKNFDAVCVSVPPAFTPEESVKAFLLGKHVLAEKPVARNQTELENAVGLASILNLRFMAGYNYRHLAHIKKARAIVDEGTIGDIMFIRGRHGASGRIGYEKEWRHDKEIGGGGALIDQSVHMIDLSRWFLGDFVKVHGTTANLFWDSPVEDNAFLNLETASGKIASIHSSWTNWKPIFSFEIFGAKGYVIAEGLKNYAQEQRLTIGRRSDDFLGSNVKEETFAFDSDFNDSLAGELDEFAASILTGREPNPNGKDALNILKIVDKIYTDSSPKLLT